MLSIVIPAYNEEKRIASTLSLLRKKFPSAYIIVVFEGDDNTPEVVKQYGGTVIINKTRIGKGGSIKIGVQKALGDKVLIIDADLPTLDVEKLVNVDADLVIAHRDVSTMPPIRRFLHHAFVFLTKLFFPSLYRFHDFQAGVKVVKLNKLKEILHELVMNDYVFDVNLVYSFVKRGYKVVEIPVKYYHKEEDSKISKKLIKIIIFMFLSLVKLRFFYSPFRKILYTKSFLKVQNWIINRLR
ncbi:glycosyltransferase [Sulfurisphaera javensis]|uniref:Glycosyltransferase n=1 Tax=Sulfurisphaera javensis TaxID=2049879 RepID=A0AAT9GQ89_9CREN